MTYYLQDYPPFDKRSTLRIFLGLVIFLGLLTGIFRLAILGIGPIEFVFGVGIPGTFVVTFLAMGLISKIFLPKLRSDLFLELSAEKIVLKKASVTAEIKNQKLQMRFLNNDDEADFIVTDEAGRELLLPHFVIPDPDHHLRMEKAMMLRLSFENGKVYLEGRKLLQTKRFSFE